MKASKRSFIMIKLISFQSRDGSTHNSTNIIHHTNVLKGRNHVIISIDIGNAFDKTHHIFMTENPEETRN